MFFSGLTVSSGSLKVESILTEKSKERSACPRAPRSACPRARAQLPPLWLLSLHGSPWFQMVTEVDPKYSCAKLDTWAATRGGFVRGRPTFYAAHRVSPAARATDPCRCMCASYATAFVHQDTGSTTLQDSTCREPFVWQRCTRTCPRDLHHPSATQCRTLLPDDITPCMCVT